MPGNMDEVSRIIGNIEGEIKGQRRALSDYIDESRRVRGEAAEDRRELLTAFSNFKNDTDKRLAKLEQCSEDHSNKLSLIIPTIEEWEILKAQTRGAAKLGRIVYLMMTGLIVAVTWTLAHLYQLFSVKN